MKIVAPFTVAAAAYDQVQATPSVLWILASGYFCFGCRPTAQDGLFRGGPWDVQGGAGLSVEARLWCVGGTPSQVGAFFGSLG